MDSMPSVRFRTARRMLIPVLVAICLGIAGSRVYVAQSTEKPRWIEFDQPANKDVTGFLVGYFLPEAKRPAHSYQLDRAKVQWMGDTVKVPLLLGRLPAGQTFQVRIRSIAGKRRSPWSEPSSPFKVTEEMAAASQAVASPEKPADATAADSKAGEARPADAKPADGGKRAGKEGRRPKTPPSAAKEFEQNPQLRERVAKLFPERDLKKAAEGFPTVRDMVAAMYAADNLKIPFDELQPLAAGTGKGKLRKAIAKLKPDVNARDEAAKAQKQSKVAVTIPTTEEKK